MEVGYASIFISPHGMGLTKLNNAKIKKEM